MTTADAFPWWKEEGSHLAEATMSEADEVEHALVDRAQHGLDSYALYQNLASWPGAASKCTTIPADKRVTHNILAQAIDTGVTEVMQSRPRPLFLTTGAGWDAHNRAAVLTRYMETLYQHQGIRDLDPSIVRDSALAGLGAARPYAHCGKVYVERVFPMHLLMDDRLSYGALPRALFHRRFPDRYMLAEQYPDNGDEIMAAAGPQEWHVIGWDSTLDVVDVVEAWHLPSSPEAEDGIYVKAISGCVLEQRPWTRDRFPFSFMRGLQAPWGYWGLPIAARAETVQIELNKLARRTQESHHLFAVPKVLMPRQAHAPRVWTNKFGECMSYDGPHAPTVVVPQAMSPEVYRHMDRLADWIFAETGVSGLSATSQKPAGLNSKPSLRAYGNVQARRFINVGRAYERYHMDLAREIVECERQIARDNPGHKVSAKRWGTMQRYRWQDIDLDDDERVLTLFPASALPNDPAGRLEALGEMLERGAIDLDTYWQESEVPDLEGVRARVTAPLDLLHMRFDSFLNGGPYVPPDTTNHLRLGIRECLVAIAQGELYGAKRESLANLRKWLGEAKRIMGQPDPQVPQPPISVGPPGAAPPMPPGPPPPMGPPPGGPQPGPMPPQGLPALPPPMPA